MRLAPILGLAALTALLAANSVQASGQTADAVSAEPSSTKADASQGGDSLTVGLGVAYLPAYAGSDESRLMPAPYIERTFGNGFFIGTGRGLGYQVTLGDFSASAALSYGGKRDEHKRTLGAGSDALKGMGEVEGGAQAILAVSYRLGSVGLSLGTMQNLSRWCA